MDSLSIVWADHENWVCGVLGNHEAPGALLAIQHLAAKLSVKTRD